MEFQAPRIRPDLVERYLGLLRVKPRTPSFDGLRELVQAHACRVPFENVSKLYYKRHFGRRSLVPLEVFLDGIERYRFGGTCYPNNYYLYLLLANLGYRAILCGADMTNPDVHLVSIVELEARSYIVDVGYAAPFLAPLPCDLPIDHVVSLGPDRYVLRPRDAAGRSRLEMVRDGDVKHGYVVKPKPRRIDEFDAVIADSFRDDATFMNALLLARFWPGRSLVVRNLTLTESHDSETLVRTLAGGDELVRVIWESFGIPPEITGDAMSGLSKLGDAWS